MYIVQQYGGAWSGSKVLLETKDKSEALKFAMSVAQQTKDEVYVVDYNGFLRDTIWTSKPK